MKPLVVVGSALVVLLVGCGSVTNPVSETRAGRAVITDSRTPSPTRSLPEPGDIVGTPSQPAEGDLAAACEALLTPTDTTGVPLLTQATVIITYAETSPAVLLKESAVQSLITRLIGVGRDGGSALQPPLSSLLDMLGSVLLSLQTGAAVGSAVSAANANAAAGQARAACA